MGFDLYPVELIQNKKRLTDQAAREGWLCVFVHDPRDPLGNDRGRDEAANARVHVVPTGRPRTFSAVTSRSQRDLVPSRCLRPPAGR